ncbi:hypothetical protein C900_02192 [Fulvivirga imtechensis AK7]|uniref:DUF4129 domain-containing protein n=1 Tax=Fulvivirga imtechensis AK7 TaxID=1237149 RepID=L8JX77_9BACT|nr:hypothetical protein [Fulvivirga imtechensis]ELR71817.1 hypothetical protein C900_02192 [Fulvivirga imtechensis AK7]
MFKGIISSLVLVLFFVAMNAQGQQIEPRGQFLSDSIKIGVPVAYSLAVKYPKELDIIFPDSLYNYAPFEFDKKRYFPTRSDSVYSYDSAVYYITSFEVDSIQHISLPVYVLHGRDSTAVYASSDTVVLQQLVTEIPDSVAVEAMPLKENTTYKRVAFQFNYPYFIIGAIILVIIAVLVFIFFGNKIRRYFFLRRMEKSHRKFIETYDAIALAKDQSVKLQAEKLLVVWKKYHEQLEARPYTKLTTKEIIRFYQPEGIETSLKALDRTIYSPKANGELMGDYTALKKYSQKRYEEKVEEVKHG